MRDRGITRAGLKAPIAAAVAAFGAIALIWGIWNGEAPAAGSAKSLGTVTLVVALLATLNYLYAHHLVRQLHRGEGVIAKWVVSPDELARFRDLDHARSRGKNNWRVPRRRATALPVIFGTDAVLVGHTYFRLAAHGISRFTFARVEGGAVPYVEFAMKLIAYGAGTQARTVRYRGHLRIPIGSGAHVEAARAIGHFRAIAGI